MIEKVANPLSNWIAAKLELRRLLALALLLVALNSVGLGLANVVKGLDLGLLLLVTVLGLLIGWGLAGSPLPGWLASSVAAVLGIEIAVVRIGNLGGILATLLGALIDLAWGVWRWPLVGSPDITPMLQLLAELGFGVKTLLSRLFDWSLGLATGEPAFDPVAVTLVWALALWAVAAWAGWMVRRYDQPFLGVLPAGALLVVSQSYVGGNFTFLLLLLGVTWLLLALVGHTARERRWQVAEIDYALDIRVDLTIVTIWLTSALVVMAGIAPSVSVRQVAELAQRLIWGQPLEAGPVARSLGLQPQPIQPTAFDKVRVGGLPRRHLLGSGPELSQRVVMIIHAGATHFQSFDYAQDKRASHLEFPPRYYWRSLIYDRYTGRGWLTGKTKTVTYSAGEPVIVQTAEVSKTSGVLTRQELRVVGDLGGLLHVAGMLVTVDQDYEVAWRAAGDAFGATIAATTYQAESLVPVVTEAELRTARSVYPEAVRHRYLALPNEVPARVLALARDLTATEPTPYDRARAIEAYLRTFPYDLNLPLPPPDRDVVDYFLFDLQRGYCDYYATAMVVLARAAGLPARLVVGYASGTYDAANERYLVTEADAHAWPELYFSGYGWIEFEPTAARPPLERSAESMPIVSPEVAAAPLLTTAPGRTGWSGLWWLSLAGGMVALLLGGAIWTVADSWRLRHLPPAATVERLYQRLRRNGHTLAVLNEAGDTPYEFSASLAKRLTDLAQTGRWKGILTPAVREAQGLADLYVRLTYSAHRPDAADRIQAVQIWQRLRWRLWLAYMRLTLKHLRLKVGPRPAHR
jgi:transglutaminase-like putative cysteine protease